MRAQKFRLCAVQNTGKRRINTASEIAGGSTQPESLPTMSVASKVSRNTRPTRISWVWTPTAEPQSSRDNQLDFVKPGQLLLSLGQPPSEHIGLSFAPAHVQQFGDHGQSLTRGKRRGRGVHGVGIRGFVRFFSAAPPFKLSSDKVDWAMQIASGRSCTRGLKLGPMNINEVKVIASPKSGQLATKGPSFSYTAKPDFEGQDDFTLLGHDGRNSPAHPISRSPFLLWPNSSRRRFTASKIRG